MSYPCSPPNLHKSFSPNPHTVCTSSPVTSKSHTSLADAGPASRHKAHFGYVRRSLERRTPSLFVAPDVSYVSYCWVNGTGGVSIRTALPFVNFAVDSILNDASIVFNSPACQLQIKLQSTAFSLSILHDTDFHTARNNARHALLNGSRLLAPVASASRFLSVIGRGSLKTGTEFIDRAFITASNAPTLCAGVLRRLAYFVYEVGHRPRSENPVRFWKYAHCRLVFRFTVGQWPNHWSINNLETSGRFAPYVSGRLWQCVLKVRDSFKRKHSGSVPRFATRINLSLIVVCITYVTVA